MTFVLIISLLLNVALAGAFWVVRTVSNERIRELTAALKHRK